MPSPGSAARKERLPAWPSAPPSETSTSFSSQTARLPSTTEPGTIALKLDDSAHAPPMVVLAVAAHGTVNGNGLASAVAASLCEEPLKRSVICTNVSNRSSPA